MTKDGPRAVQEVVGGLLFFVVNLMVATPAIGFLRVASVLILDSAEERALLSPNPCLVWTTQIHFVKAPFAIRRLCQNTRRRWVLVGAVFGVLFLRE